MARLREPAPANTGDIDIHNDSSSERRARSSTAPTPPFSPHQSSDKENQTARAKRAMPPPTHRRPRDDEDADDEVDETDAPSTSKRRRISAAMGAARLADNPDTEFFDPNQDKEERREVRSNLRELHKDASENRLEWLKPEDKGLHQAVERSNDIYKNVKQTSDATIDSRFLTIAGEIALKKTQKLAMEEGASGIDVDQFVSKCISFMNAGGDGGQSRPARRGDDSDEEEEENGDALNWAWLGAQACFPSNSRPPTAGFLLGPLSVQKRVRKVTVRKARQTKQQRGTETRPDELRAEDLQQSENNTLTAMCTKAWHGLAKVAKRGRAAMARENTEEMDDIELAKLMDKNNMSIDQGVPMFKYALNPHSFGQSVENLFYISFMIKEGKIELRHDEDGMPVLHAREIPYEQGGAVEDDDESREGRTGLRNQTVFALDHPTYYGLLEAYDIREPLIPHRDEAESTQVTASGWYK